MPIHPTPNAAGSSLGSRRAIVLMLDSVGIGGAPDAERYGDAGANTLGHIIAACRAGHCDRAAVRHGPLAIPNLTRRGLLHAVWRVARTSNPELLPLLPPPAAPPTAAYGHAVEQSCGKDTPSGHLEMAGVPIMFEWGTFPNRQPSFPPALTQALIARGDLPGVLGNCHASGTEILDRLGEEHLRTGQPIIYTSVDSVFQIAAHEDPAIFGLERLYALCELARRLVDEYGVGRVIARPFIGQRAGEFRRTAHRRDYALPPPGTTLLDRVAATGEVIAVGKVGDIYAQRGVTQRLSGDGNDALFDATLEAVREAPPSSLIFTNFVDFDTIYGHRRDVTGYAAALEAFDRRLPELDALLQPDDLVVITADHGTDPTWRGTDHTREQVPVLFYGAKVASRYLGQRQSYADIGQTIAHFLNVPALDFGTACW